MTKFPEDLYDYDEPETNTKKCKHKNSRRLAVDDGAIFNKLYLWCRDCGALGHRQGYTSDKRIVWKKPRRDK